MQRPDLGTLIGRALRLKCPRCGTGDLFRNLFAMHSNCEHCDLKYERAPGYFLGSIYINYGLTAMTVTVAFVVMKFILEIPDRRFLPFLLAYCVLFPTFFYRYARALWLSIDSFFDTEDIWTE